MWGLWRSVKSMLGFMGRLVCTASVSTHVPRPGVKKMMLSFYRANSIKTELSGRDMTNGGGVQSALNIATNLRPAEIRHLRKPISRLTNIQILSAIKIFISPANFFEFLGDLLYPRLWKYLKRHQRVCVRGQQKAKTSFIHSLSWSVLQ